MRLHCRLALRVASGAGAASDDSIIAPFALRGTVAREPASRLEARAYSIAPRWLHRASPPDHGAAFPL